MNITTNDNTSATILNDPNIPGSIGYIENRTEINCGESSNYSCFINASKTCHPAKWVYYSESEFIGTTISSFTHFQLKGYSPEGKCIFYQKNMDGDSIAEQICKFNQTALTEMLARWQNGHYSTTDYSSAECYPHDNFECRLAFDGWQIAGISLNGDNSLNNGYPVSVKGYSNPEKVYWEIDNQSVIRLSSFLGPTINVYPLKVGETFITVADTSLDSCRLRFSFEVFPD